MRMSSISNHLPLTWMKWNHENSSGPEHQQSFNFVSTVMFCSSLTRPTVWFLSACHFIFFVLVFLKKCLYIKNGIYWIREQNTSRQKKGHLQQSWGVLPCFSLFIMQMNTHANILKLTGTHHTISAGNKVLCSLQYVPTQQTLRVCGLSITKSINTGKVRDRISSKGNKTLSLIRPKSA